MHLGHAWQHAESGAPALGGVTARWVMTAHNGQNAILVAHSSWARAASASFLCCAMVASSSRISLGLGLTKAMSEVRNSSCERVCGADRLLPLQLRHGHIAAAQKHWRPHTMPLLRSIHGRSHGGLSRRHTTELSSAGARVVKVE